MTRSVTKSPRVAEQCDVNIHSLDHQKRHRVIWLCSTPILREVGHSGGGSGPLTSSPFPPSSREELRLNGCVEYPYVIKALYIYKHPYLFRDSNTGPTAQQSGSLTTISNDTNNKYIDD
ncbi:uncharacterized protein TNCV_998301 [Trichonephila clavipes]|nr:uncharacterized protein TNCV_998301 [Trichonephila clavipes]